MQTPDASPAPAAGAGLRIAPDDLLALLAVARLGKYTAAAASMGVNHTTVSRRIAALEKAVGDRVLWGAGLHPNITKATLKAIVSAVNRAAR